MLTDTVLMQHTQQLLSILMEDGEIGGWELNLASRMLTLTGKKVLLDLFGIDEVCISLSWEQYLEDYCHPDDHSAAQQDLQAALLESAEYCACSFRSEYRVWNREWEKWHYVLVFGRIVHSGNRDLLICGIQEAIRPGGHTQAGIRPQDCLQAALEAAPMACVCFDRSARPIDCNLDAAHLLGLSSKVELLRRFYDLSPEYQPDGHPSSQEMARHIQTALREGRQSLPWLYCQAGGKTIPCRITFVRFPYADDYLVIAYIADEREQPAGYQSLRKANERMQMMLDASPICCTLWDRSGELLECNQAAAELFGLPDQASFLQKYSRLVPPAQPDGRPSLQTLRNYLQLAFEGHRVSFQWTHQTAQGDLFPTEVLIVRAPCQKNFVALGYIRDLRPQKVLLDNLDAAKEEMRRSRDLAREDARAKSRFLSDVSGELSAPLGVVSNMLRQALKAPLERNQRKQLEVCQSATTELLKLTGDILDYSRLEMGLVELELEDFSLSDLLYMVTDSLAGQITDKNLRLEYCFDPKIPDSLYGDPHRLGQVMYNLLDNAVKYTYEGIISIAVHPLEIRTETVGLLFRVRDGGVGISEEQASRLFLPFAQPDVSARQSGAGLGLAICQKLLDLMNGAIWCESSPGSGSTFYFTAELGVSG